MLKTTPMPHQHAAVEKLSRFVVGGLFMEMGTGKSLAAIMAALKRNDRIDKVVWFTPVTLRDNVRIQIETHVEGPSVYVFDDRTTLARLPKAFWYVAGIESMSASPRVQLTLANLIDERTMVILDESQFCKNPFAERTRWITGLSKKARYRLLLTGTPISKGIEDLFAQMFFLDERILGYRSYYSFASNHLEYHKKRKGFVVRAHNVPWLSAKIAPYIYQVTKAECLELPPKLYETIWVSMSPEQRDLYHFAKEELFREIEECDDEELESCLVYRLFTALRQAACGFWNDTGNVKWRRSGRTPNKYEVPHYRLETFRNLVRGIESPERVVTWAQWIRDIDDIKAAMAEDYGQSNVCEITGRVKPKDRATEIERFRDGARILAMTPSSGGHGLTLTEAKYSIIYANGLKFSERMQLEDRIHRIGQQFPTTYITIGMAGTIDERIAELLASKKSLAEYLRDNVQKIRDKTGRVEALRELIGDVKRDEAAAIA